MLSWAALRNRWPRLIRATKAFFGPGLLPSGLSRSIHSGEPLARFLTSSNQFSTEKEMAKSAAFLPNKQGETSVCRHGEEPRDQLWQVGREYLGGGRSLYGVAVFTAHDVRTQELDVIPKEPPPRHANIVGWPSDADPEMAKAKRKQRALALAACATLLRLEDN